MNWRRQCKQHHLQHLNFAVVHLFYHICLLSSDDSRPYPAHLCQDFHTQHLQLVLSLYLPAFDEKYFYYVVSQHLQMEICVLHWNLQNLFWLCRIQKLCCLPLCIVPYGDDLVFHKISFLLMQNFCKWIYLRVVTPYIWCKCSIMFWNM